MGQSPLDDDDEIELSSSSFKQLLPLVLVPILIFSALYQMY